MSQGQSGLLSEFDANAARRCPMVLTFPSVTLAISPVLLRWPTCSSAALTLRDNVKMGVDQSIYPAAKGLECIISQLPH